MKDSLILEGKIYISARRAAKIINYAQDYIGQLCRAKKLDCKMVGRSWFVTEESLLAHRQTAIDATDERVNKIVKDVKLEITKEYKPEYKPEVEDKIEKVAKPVASPFKYEPVSASLLPELKKRIPETLSVAKSVAAVRAPSSFYVDVRKQNSLKPLSVFFIALTIGAIGFIFTVSLTYNYNGHSNLSRNNQASVASIAEEIWNAVVGGVHGVSQHLAMYFENNPSGNTTSSQVPKQLSNQTSNSSSDVPINNTSSFNGIGIVPSESVKADEIEKGKIRNSFSDEVSIHPDQSGTAGVITPVFKQNKGDDFVYVLVPVKDKEQK